MLIKNFSASDDLTLMSSFYINDYEFSNFSQNGEDGIIELLSKYLINNNYYFAEVGCGNGLENNSTNLVLGGWSGVVFDAPSNIYINIVDYLK